MNKLAIPLVMISFVFSGCAKTGSIAHVIAEKDGIVMFNVDSQTLSSIIKDNSLVPFGDWPVYRTTSYEMLSTPKCLKEKGKTEPKWPGKDLGFYKITTTSRDGKSIYFLYHSEAQVLVIK